MFESPLANAAGVYLWTIKQQSDNTHLIHCVGETASFGKRHREHLINVLGLDYGIFHPEKAERGICELVWPGLWRMKNAAGPAKQIEAYRSIQEHVIGYLSIVNIFFAELNTDTRLRKLIQGCIGWNLRRNHPECKVLYPDDNHVGTIPVEHRGELQIITPESIQGFDGRIPY